MAGIYLHIPFCKRACHYCNFHFSTSLRYKNEFVGALLKEIELQQDFLLPDQISTIYFGGGTPSLLEMDELTAILDKLREIFHLTADAEITLEANPDDINEDKLLGWKEAGINRLSIGVQSFFEEDLVWMNRAHNAVQSKVALELALKLFSNITIDLIYGSPQLSDEKWKSNVDRALALGIPHLSCYALTVEPRTRLDKMISEHQTMDVDPERQSAQFVLLMDWLNTAGYEHYEISNFALPGYRSRHNSSYWQGRKYLGLGPSAHSFDGFNRQWNVANNTRYIESIQEGNIPFERETLSTIQRANEAIMIGLRTMEGIDPHKFSLSDFSAIRKRADKYITQGLMTGDNERLILTQEGKLLADGIAADLFFDHVE